MVRLETRPVSVWVFGIVLKMADLVRGRAGRVFRHCVYVLWLGDVGKIACLYLHWWLVPTKCRKS